jgi:hypothetical protein
MATAKQPQPTAMKMTSNISVLPSSETRLGPQRQDDQKGKAQVPGQYDADLEDDVAEARAIGVRFVPFNYMRPHSRS